MKSKIVADGWPRLRKAREREIREKIEAKYAEALSRVTFVERGVLRAKIESEILQEVQRHSPSPYALYVGQEFKRIFHAG